MGQLNSFIEWITENTRRVFLFFFIIPLGIGIIVQVGLMYIFPELQAGDGLLAGGDWYTFHTIALDLTNDIKEIGWGAWELRPKNQSPAGIAAIFYVLITPKPWVLLPLNAFLHALAAFLLYKIIRQFVGERKIAFLAVMPFFLYPSAAYWYSQIHKDGFYIAGFMLVLFGWIQLTTKIDKPVLHYLLNFFYMVIGVFLIWVARFYAVEIFQGVFLVMALFSSVILVIRALKSKNAILQSAIVIIMLWGLALEVNPDFLNRLFPEKQPASSSVADTPQETDAYKEVSVLPWEPQIWTNSGWPVFVEALAFKLSGVRDSFRVQYPEAGSNYETSVRFSNIYDIIKFLPKATYIGFFSPFPNQWLEEGSQPTNTIMRRISGLEMIGIYISYLGIPLAFSYWKKEQKYWIVLGFVCAMVLVYSLVIVNLGTLYRFRYGFIMTFTALNYAALLSYVLPKLAKPQPELSEKQSKIY